MATAIDLGDMASPHGGIHPRLKQEVGRRLALVARAVQFLEPVTFEGPTLQGVHLTDPSGTAAVVTFVPATARGLHLSGTAGCHDCCATPLSNAGYAPFEVQAPNGTWLPVTARATVRRNTIELRAPVPISGVRSGWGRMPDCLLYNGGLGGALNHSGLVAPPFRACVYGDNGLPAWSWLSDCAPRQRAELWPEVGGAVLPSGSLADWMLGQTAVVRGPPDAYSSGIALQTGLAGQGASWRSRTTIACAASSQLVDRVELRLRYRALPPNASSATAADMPATLSVALISTDTKAVATIASAVPLGNYSAPTGFSAPLHLAATNLRAACDGGAGSSASGRLLLQFAVTNNDRPVTFPIDDLAGGFMVSVMWAAAGR